MTPRTPAAVHVVRLTVRWLAGRAEERFLVAAPPLTLDAVARALDEAPVIDPDAAALRAAVLDAAGRDPVYLDPLVRGVWPWLRGAVELERVYWFDASAGLVADSEADALDGCGRADPDDADACVISIRPRP